jgi:crotonobetainyl-CoA:carnitine CoA-transferase CaiB-like acyl-CoA transferase
MMLGDQGAQVTRIERPGGPAMAGPASAVLNRGKRTVSLDLKNPGDVETARRLIAEADVLIENFRPGVMSRLGLGYDALRTTNPGLVYLSLPAFAHDDVPAAAMPGWEGVVAAAMGQFTDMGLNRTLMGIEASYSPLTLASAYASVFGALAVVLALRSRTHSALGDFIEVPLAAALMEGLAYNSMRVEELPERYKSLREREIERRRAAGLPMNLSYEQLQPFLDPFYRTYRCRDGRPFYVVAGSHLNHAERVLKVLGLWEEMLAAGVPLADPYLPLRDWPDGADCTLRAYPITEPWAARLTERMTAAFLTKDSAEWERLFGEAGAPAAAHRTTQEWLHSIHPRQAGLIVEIDDPVHGKMLQPGPVAWLEKCLPSISQGSLPQRAGGAPAAESPPILSTARSQEPASGTTPRLWLDGITVLDMTNVIAGPTIGGTLARFGARVIKIDAVVPTYDPWNTVVFGIYGNRSKESVLIDVKTDEGRQILTQLIETADVITINAVHKQLGALGLDFDRLQKINPRVILCHLDAFGGPGRGPRSDYPGYDDLVQASTGIMERFGGSLATVEEHAHFGTIDVLGGLAAAFAVSLALYRREQTGRGDIARSSLAAAGQWLQSRFMFDFDGRPPFDEPRGRQAKGEGPLYRCYRAADRWFFFAAGPLGWSKLAGSQLFVSITGAPAAQREALLEEIFQSNTADFWAAHLRPFDVAVQPLESLAEVRRVGLTGAALAKTVEFMRDYIHPSGRAVEHVVPKAVRPRRAALRPGFAAPKYGSSTRELLRQLGYSSDDIERMIRDKVIADSWSSQYVPD